MPRRRILWQLFPVITVVTVLVVVAAGWHVLSFLKDVYYAEAAKDLESRARLIEPRVAEALSAEDDELVRLAQELGRRSATRITVVLPSGEVVADSDHDLATMDNHADRPEIQEACADRRGVATRYSFTLDEQLMYVAIPLSKGDRVSAVLRTARPVSAVDEALTTLRRRIILLGIALAAVMALGALALTQRLAAQLDGVRDAAQRFARGELGYRLPTQGSAEASGLALAMNDMAAQFDEQLRSLAQERNEREALLTSMVEGVIAVDSDERVIMLNRAAGELFGVEPAEARGRMLQEVARYPALQQLAHQALEAGHVVEAEVEVTGEGVRHLQAHGTLLRGVEGHGDAVLLVLNDVTNLRRLETIRRDFVANVSHELRTPITSIRGFVETLRDGALNDPGDARRFLGIIEKQADRLNAITEDLLALSRLEQPWGRTATSREPTPLLPIVEAAIDACNPGAAAKSIRLRLEADDNPVAWVNDELLEQAIVNLIDNAVKYSGPDTAVTAHVSQSDAEVVIRVADEGPGIEARHLDRIFERFYRVDKARSRQAGGTGLGLAIVKHIAQAHGGHVDVESTLGLGSTFSIHIPL